MVAKSTLPQPIWCEQLKVRVFEADLNNRWKPTAFFHAMEEAAANHARNLGYDYPDMIAKGMIWVLARLKIRFDDFPTIPEKIILQTFPRGIQQKIFFTRDFLFTSVSGRRLAVATSAWLLIDPHKRRMLLPNTLPGKLPLNEGLSALNENLEKISLPAEMTAVLTRQAAYSDLDLMNHVNNARYVEWICDCFPPDHYRRYQPDWLQINYNHEVLPGAGVTLSVGQRSDEPLVHAICGTLDGSETRAFEAEIGWRERRQPE
ncbi:MAG: acyl-ACP thioesterase domain-containing protein [Chloroflexota bacterium]